jgi:hypothetical protein
MSRGASLMALALALASWAIWIVNALEILVLHPRFCSLARMHFESWIFMARLVAIVGPFCGLPLALFAFRAPRPLRASAVAANMLALGFVAALSLRLVGMGHLPCLRD